MRIPQALVIAIALGACAPQQKHAQTRQAATVQLGQKLFSDTSLSSDQKVSCASCHIPSQLFADAKPVAVGINRRIGTRNAPSLLDVTQASSFFWEGRETRLEDVVLQPLTNPMEMGLHNHEAVLQRIEGDPIYAELSTSAFGKEALQIEGVATALAAYLRSLPSHKSRYDRYVESGQHIGFRDDELQGLLIFKEKAGCTECHRLEGQPAMLTDHQFHHTGVGFERVAGDLGVMIRKLDQIQRSGVPLGTALLSNADIAELGRFTVTRRPQDLGAFRTPSLRNVAATAPYMHDGSVPTLQAAVEREIYYRSLARGRPITLTVEEQQQLIAFLGALSTSP